MMKRTILVSFFVAITRRCFAFFYSQKERKPKVLKTIVVDAGHGLMPDGGHNGAKGSYSYEDDICLSISRELDIPVTGSIARCKDCGNKN